MLPIAALALSATAPVLLDPAKEQGIWEGWGTSLCWMGNVFGERDDVADLLFTLKDVPLAGETLPGLGMTIARYNVGACSPNTVDGKTMGVSKIILPYRQMEGFWLDGQSEDPKSASWDWNRDPRQRAMLMRAKARGANRFELFSNSPMWWMCANYNPSGAQRGADDNLRPEMNEKFAIYMATVASEFKKRWGLTFTTVEPFNEPVTDYWHADCKQEGCHFSVKQQEEVLPLLRKHLDQRGLKKMRISASDETAFDIALAVWNGYSPETKKIVDQVNVHGYQGKGGNRAALYEATKGKTLWNSEHGDGDGSGRGLVQGITLDFHLLRPTAWCYWQPFDGMGWGLIQSDMVNAKEQRPTPKYFALAQYSRHIRPGMTVLTTGDPNVVAALDRKHHTLVIVLSTGTAAETKSVDLSAFKKLPKVAKNWLTELKGSAHYQVGPEVEIADSILSVSMPAESVETLEIRGIG